MHPRRLLIHSLLASSLGMGVSAQQPTAQCLPGWEWNRNSFDQDPCTVGSTLDANCRNINNYDYPKLEKTQIYLPPSRDNTDDVNCDCNTVMYSLIMACATCQEGLAYKWSVWAVACGAVYVAYYPKDIPQGTAVPQWALYNVTLLDDGEYNDIDAKNIGRDPEAMPSTQSGGSNGGKNSSGSKTAAIVGGVVGGVGVLIITPIIAYFIVQWRRRNRDKDPQLQYQYPEAHANRWKTPPNSITSAMYDHSIGQNIPLQPYNPEDPSTFPPPMPMGLPNQPPKQPATYVTPFSNFGARR